MSRTSSTALIFCQALTNGHSVKVFLRKNEECHSLGLFLISLCGKDDRWSGFLLDVRDLKRSLGRDLTMESGRAVDGIIVIADSGFVRIVKYSCKVEQLLQIRIF
jgi:hypothetical protein